MLLRLAFKNLIGAGLRSWLNAFVISLALVVVVWNQGFLVGFDQQSSQAMIDFEYGGGQYWHPVYDPHDPLSLDDAHGPVPPALQTLVDRGQATPILVAQGSIYPSGRMRTVLLKGIDPEQKVLSFPSSVLDGSGDLLPILIGNRMAKGTGLRQGDEITIRWRESGGSFNAVEGRVVHVMTTTVASIDSNTLWLPLAKLRAMMRTEGEATLVVLGQKVTPPSRAEEWAFKDLRELLRDIRRMYQVKTVGRSAIFALLLMMGMLAVFDTQVLSIFRRRKEMGTLMALGFTRGMVIHLFTLEGALHGVLAAALSAIYGMPLLWISTRIGIGMPPGTESFGVTVGERIYPVYGIALILGTTLLVLVVTTIVSFLPTRRIARLKPTDALRGTLS